VKPPFFDVVRVVSFGLSAAVEYNEPLFFSARKDILRIEFSVLYTMENTKRKFAQNCQMQKIIENAGVRETTVI